MVSKQHRYLYTDYKKAMDLLLVKGLSFKETSLITGVSINSLQKWLHDARIRSVILNDRKKQNT